jgi:hypothetical protein
MSFRFFTAPQGGFRLVRERKTGSRVIDGLAYTVRDRMYIEPDGTFRVTVGQCVNAPGGHDAPLETHRFESDGEAETFWETGVASVSCCREPMVRGGRCENCGAWISDESEMSQGDNE